METAPTINEDFLDMLQVLSDAQVDFIVVGAHALAAHGIPRATGDLDIWVRPTPPNAERVMDALRRFGAPIDSHGVKKEDFVKADAVYQLGLPPRRIDLLTGITAVTFDEAWPSRRSGRLGHLSVPFLGRDALIKNKRALGRAKDLVDVALLEKQSAP